VAAGPSQSWDWDGTQADGSPAPPGVYIIRATLSDTPRNTSERRATCWVGNLIGTTVPARPALGDRVAVRLSDPTGTAVPTSTGVRLSLGLRAAEPGGADPAIVGRRVGIIAQGPVGTTRLQLPRRIPPRRLWLIATTNQGQALIPLTP
jgi:hypothetical protein